MNSPEPQSSRPSEFQHTRWSLVVRAQARTPEARAALSELCEAYYQPVFRFLQQEGRDPDAARELAQEFFARLLSKGEVGAADPQRGKFRSYLLGAVKHFLADQRKHAAREKRGAGQQPLSLDEPVSEDGAGMDFADPSVCESDHRFDREWAFALMERSISLLEAEFQESGKSAWFAVLQPWLVGESLALSQADAARRLGVNEGAVKVAVHRMRKRLREIIRSEISQTVGEGADVDSELRYLIEVLARG